MMLGLRKKANELEAENERLRAMLENRFKQVIFDGEDAKGNLIFSDPEGNLLSLITDTFIQAFSDAGAENHVCLTFEDRQKPGDEYEVIINKVGGESAAEKLRRLTEEIEGLK